MAAPQTGVEHLPEKIQLDELQTLTFPQLLELVHRLGIRNTSDRTRHQLVFEALKTHASRGAQIFCDGIKMSVVSLLVLAAPWQSTHCM